MKRRIAVISLLAAAIWFGLRTLSSTRPLLSPADFTAGGPDALEFCDPRNPRFLAVVDRRSAVEMTAVAPNRIHLATAAGKPIGPSDLEGGLLRIFAVDDNLTSFASGAAAPGPLEGDWTFSFSGASRLFADFTPRATGQEMYAAAKLARLRELHRRHAPALRSLTLEAPTPQDAAITLSSVPQRLFARQPAELLVRAERPIARAELAVFDLQAGGPNGFAVRSPEGLNERLLRFSLNFPDPGRYVMWVETGVGSDAKFRRFETEVFP